MGRHRGAASLSWLTSEGRLATAHSAKCAGQCGALAPPWLVLDSVELEAGMPAPGKGVCGAVVWHARRPEKKQHAAASLLTHSAVCGLHRVPAVHCIIPASRMRRTRAARDVHVGRRNREGSRCRRPLPYVELMSMPSSVVFRWSCASHLCRRVQRPSDLDDNPVGGHARRTASSSER